MEINMLRVMVLVFGIFCLLTGVADHRTVAPLADKWIAVNKVKNLSQIADVLRAHAHRYPDVFPKSIATHVVPLYATASAEGDHIWLVFGDKPSCYSYECMVGSITYELARLPEMEYDDYGNLITEQVQLKGGVAAFYTPTNNVGEIMPPSLSWRCAGRYFKIDWYLPSKTEKSDIVRMGNSMVEQILRCS